MKSFMKEFKEFAMRGNVMDLAVAVIIGGAFGAIVNSLVADIISPIIGMLVGDNFANLSVKVAGATLTYGNFIMAIVNFLIIALVIFSMIKAMNKAQSLSKKEEPEEEPTTKVCPFCKSEIAIEATRCPHCTSVLEEAAAEAE